MQRIRAQDDGARRLTAIALTAHARTQDREKALAAGFSQLISMTDPEAQRTRSSRNA